MAKIIITDSTAYLPDAIISQYGVKVVPLNIHFHDRVFQEGIDLTNSDYYHTLRREPIFPLTSQPPAGNFTEIFKKLKPGDEALVILISSSLSGTIQSALLARDILANNQISITIIDSQSTTIGLAFQVIRACELIAEGIEIPVIKSELEKIQESTRLFFVVDNLEYLVRGGRISHLSKYIGNFFKIKPVLWIKSGKIEVFKKIRTKKKAINVIIEELKDYPETVERIAITHVDSPDEAQYLLKEITKIYPADIPIIETGPVIGTHVGPGSIGLAFY